MPSERPFAQRPRRLLGHQEKLVGRSISNPESSARQIKFDFLSILQFLQLQRVFKFFENAARKRKYEFGMRFFRRLSLIEQELKIFLVIN